MPNRCMNMINGEDCIDRGCGTDRCPVCAAYEEDLAMQHREEDGDYCPIHSSPLPCAICALQDADAEAKLELDNELE